MVNKPHFCPDIASGSEWVDRVSEYSHTLPHFLLQQPGHGWQRQQVKQRWHSCYHSGPNNSHGVIQTTFLLVARARPVLQEIVAPAPCKSRVPVPMDSELLTSPG